MQTPTERALCLFLARCRPPADFDQADQSALADAMLDAIAGVKRDACAGSTATTLGLAHIMLDYIRTALNAYIREAKVSDGPVELPPLLH